MKIVQVPFCFYPDPVGGTEVYVNALARELQERGHDVLIAAPWHEDAGYLHQGMRVRRFAGRASISLHDQYGGGDAQAAAAFVRIVAEEAPDLVHLHALSPGVSLRLLCATRRLGIPVVFTYHTPAVSCRRGTLLRWGREICDGRQDLNVCTRCTLHGLGLPRPIASATGRIPASVGAALGQNGLAGPAWTTLRMRELVARSHDAFHAFITEVDHIVAPCRWSRDLLLLNNVPASKVTVSPHGLIHGLAKFEREDEPSAPMGSTLRVAYIGRLDPIKGVDILIQALRAIPQAPTRLDIYGVAQGKGGEAYRRHLERLAGADERITFLPPLPSHRVVEHLRPYHLVAVPSLCLETGPLVVLEAFAAGTPVLGSRLGGITELVESEVNGLLVEPGSLQAWSEAIRHLLADRELLALLRAGVTPPRSMAQVAEEMERIYQDTAARAFPPALAPVPPQILREAVVG